MDVVELAKRLKELEDYRMELNSNRSASNKIQITIQSDEQNFRYTLDDCSTVITDATVKCIEQRIEEIKKDISENLYPVRNAES